MVLSMIILSGSCHGIRGAILPPSRRGHRGNDRASAGPLLGARAQLTEEVLNN